MSLRSIAELAALFCTHPYSALFLHRAMETSHCAMESPIVQWKGLLRAMETRTACNGKLACTGMEKYVTPSEPGHMDNPILQLHEQDALHRLVNAIDR